MDEYAEYQKSKAKIAVPDDIKWHDFIKTISKVGVQRFFTLILTKRKLYEQDDEEHFWIDATLLDGASGIRSKERQSTET